ncbi:uncharacterized protein METZ01_LOCUS443766 [marine metagenome]|uniref:YXWGXW repeat-containing protein n=1 Tax=marine metagenome TaxID=408172 RepID=A0A382Z5Z7_9ZZZZ
MKKTLFSAILLTIASLISFVIPAQVVVKTNKNRDNKKVIVKKPYLNHGVRVKTNRNRVVVKKPNRPKVIVKHPNKVRRGHFWVDGYWKWSTLFNAYFWVDGFWKRNRNGYVWIPGFWEETPVGFFWVKGYWNKY